MHLPIFILLVQCFCFQRNSRKNRSAAWHTSQVCNRSAHGLCEVLHLQFCFVLIFWRKPVLRELKSNPTTSLNNKCSYRFLDFPHSLISQRIIWGVSPQNCGMITLWGGCGSLFRPYLDDVNETWKGGNHRSQYFALAADASSAQDIPMFCRQRLRLHSSHFHTTEFILDYS